MILDGDIHQGATAQYSNGEARVQDVAADTSGVSHSPIIVTLGVTANLIMPGESLWRRAAYDRQPPLVGSLSFSPFANVSIPSRAAVAYAALFLVVELAVAIGHFQKRDL